MAWFLRRWQIEVTFQAVRAHLGGKTQRQWSTPTISRTTPVLLGLFSWVTVTAHVLLRGRRLPPAWTDGIALYKVQLSVWPKHK